MFKSKGLDSKTLENKKADANATPIIATTVQPQSLAGERNAARPEADMQASTGTVSCIGSGMSIVGNIECNGPAQVFGRIEGRCTPPTF